MNHRGATVEHPKRERRPEKAVLFYSTAYKQLKLLGSDDQRRQIRAKASSPFPTLKSGIQTLDLILKH